jgi:hypothetical protein
VFLPNCIKKAPFFSGNNFVVIFEKSIFVGEIREFCRLHHADSWGNSEPGCPAVRQNSWSFVADG